MYYCQVLIIIFLRIKKSTLSMVCFLHGFYHSLDASEQDPSIANSTPRRLLDIELHCKDGIVSASSHSLAVHSVVFEKMLFSVVQMEESKTSIIRLDDVTLAEMELLLKFCRFRLDYKSLVENLSKEFTISIIRVAHRFEFIDALNILCVRLLEVIPLPSAAEIQFADRFELLSVLAKWSVICATAAHHAVFMMGLVEFPISAIAMKLFVDASFAVHSALLLPKCIY